VTTTIDAFISVPLLISAAAAALVFLFLLLIRLRKKAKIRYIFFVVAAVIIVGSLYCYYTEYYINFVFAIIIAQGITLPYLIIKTFDNPQKREEKKAAKKAAEIAASRDADMVSKQVVAEIEEKHQRLLDVNKDLISKLSSFFSSDNSMENYLEYCNDLIAQRVSADGCIILMADDYDNTLAVKSFKGSFPPPYKLPDDLPHKPIRVETNLRFAQFQPEGNIFGEIFTSGEPAFIPDSIRDPRIFQNGPEEFLRCGGYIFAPIKQPEGVVGLIGLARLPDKEKFTKQDFDTVVILADAISTTMKPLYSFLAYAEHTELNKGGSIASKYQKD
jgi:sigma-B regulation protein RsbU (phosphoserine phosphatase)